MSDLKWWQVTDQEFAARARKSGADLNQTRYKPHLNKRKIRAAEAKAHLDGLYRQQQRNMQERQKRD